MRAGAGGPRASSRRKPRSEAHAALGAALKRARTAAGATTRTLGYASGHISNVEGGHTTPSRTLLDAYIELGADRSEVQSLFDAVQTTVADARDARHRSPARQGGATAVGQIDADTRPDDVRLQYAVQHYDLQLDFDGRGRLLSFAADVLIRAAVPGVRFYFTGLSLARDESRPEPAITVLDGAELERVHHYESGASDVYLRLARELHPDDPEPHRLAYVVRPADDVLADPAMHYAARVGTNHHSLTLRFTEPALPAKLWRVSASDAIASFRLGPQDELPVVADGVYAERFDRLTPGWTYGMSWLWPKGLK